MDKTLKLQRYVRKDYSETVAFPVEIVGRDGYVRRYPFEDAIRLYQRRITFAPVRYRDTELITAEVCHCRYRIDQLRRSYFHRHGWGTPEGQESPLDTFGEFAGELAAFICRVVRADGRPDVRLTPADGTGSSTRSTWYLHVADRDVGMMLYVHVFQGDSADVAREQFFDELKELERMQRTSSSSGRLVAFHHTVDCGFVLTGNGEDVAAFDASGRRPVRQLSPTPEDRAVRLIRRRELEAALQECRSIVSRQPYSRVGYLLGAAVAVRLGAYGMAEDFALVGSRYFPDEPLLVYYRGVARAALGRGDEAVNDLEAALAVEPGLVAARWALALAHIDEQRYGSAARAARLPVGSTSRRGVSTLRRLSHWARYRQVLVAAGSVSFWLGVAAMALGGWIGLVPVLLGLAMALGGALAFRLKLELLEARSRFDEPVWVLRRLPSRGGTDEPYVS